MPDVSGKIVNFAVREVQAVTELLQALEKLRALRKEYDALSYGGGIADEDLTGPVAHLAAADLGSAFFSHEAVENLLSSGHYTNLFKLTL